MSGGVRGDARKRTQLARLEAAADAAYERFMAAASYYSAASDAHIAASSALAAALIEHQEKP